MYKTETENPVATQSTTLDPSVVLIQHQRPGDAWRVTGIDLHTGSAKMAGA